MIHARKMVLVSPEEASRLREDDSPQPIETAGSLNVLDTEMRQILEAPGQTDHEKWTLYRQVLLKFMGKLREKKQTQEEIDDGGLGDEQPQLAPQLAPQRATPSSFDAYNSDLVESFETERLRNKARVLINLLRRNKNIMWDSSGDVSIGGAAVPSSFAELLRGVLTARKADRPLGWGPFHDLLLRMNVPSTYIGRIRPAKPQKSPRIKIQKKKTNEAKTLSKWRPY
jgi:hypothetical protein